MSAGPKLRVAIVGYGVAGIAASIFLRRLGHEIVHFEQAGAPSFAGAGLLLQPTGLAVLEAMGLGESALSRGTPIARLAGRNLRGDTVMDLRYDELEPGLHGLGIQRGALFDLLRGADPGFGDLRTAHRIARADAERGDLFLEDGRALGSFDLIVGADGMDSRVRCAPLVRFDRPYRWGALLCLLDDIDGVFRDTVVQRFDGASHVSIWPVGALGPNLPRRVNLSWRTSVAEHAQLLASDVESWKRRVSRLCPEAAPLLRPIARMSDLLPATYRDIALRRCFAGRVVLLGDAAHCMSPQLGQGAGMALLDALGLAAALEQQPSVPAALAEFDRARRTHVATYQRLSRVTTPVFQSGNQVLIALRDRAFHPLSRLPLVRRSMLTTLSGAIRPSP